MATQTASRDCAQRAALATHSITGLPQSSRITLPGNLELVIRACIIATDLMAPRTIKNIDGLIERYKRGDLVKLIAYEHECSEATVRRIANQYGLGKRLIRKARSATDAAAPVDPPHPKACSASSD